ncbi:eCIS core domain-containing protein [Lunatibacter salilacus]|uniref:eCIS core domain-containing protein n=1 Tax=Lunatibacter salilacus TaxID=2483804 RepID=UPI00131DA92E|nr:DUF4157 domain-containing protein [Lunatibacter salilacus]
MHSTVLQNTPTKQSNGSSPAVWNKQEVDLEQKRKEAVHFEKPYHNVNVDGSAGDNPSKPVHNSFNFNKIPILPGRDEKIQPKLKINKPGDKYEQEADAMADRVMRMPEIESHNFLSLKPLNCIQRKCADCEEEETVQRKEQNSGTVDSQSIAIQLSEARGQGHPLPSAIQRFMSRSIGTDFSNVRVHTNSSAADMTQKLNARAFTNGSDIFFNFGEYAPDSPEGRHLLAHELTHVVQQQNSLSLIQRKTLSENITATKNPHLLQNSSQRQTSTALNEFIAQLEERIQKDGLTPQLLASEIENGNYSPKNKFPREVRSFLYDLMKDSKQYKTAAKQLIVGAFALKTSSFRREMYEYIFNDISSKGKRFRKELIKQLIKQKRYNDWINILLNRIADLIVNPVDEFPGEYADLDKPSEFVTPVKDWDFQKLQNENEAFILGYELILEVDGILKNSLPLFVEASKKESVYKDNIINNLLNLIVHFRKNGEEDEPAQLKHYMAGEIEKLVNKAQSFDSSLDSQRSRLNSSLYARTISQRDLPTELVEIIKDNEDVKELRQVLNRTNLFKQGLDADNVVMQDLDQIIEDLRDNLQRIDTKLQSNRDDALKVWLKGGENEENNESQYEKAMAYGIVQILVNSISKKLKDDVLDKSLIDGIVNYQDYLDYLQIHAAFRVRRLALTMDWKELMNLVNPLLFANNKNELNLILVGEWVEQKLHDPLKTFQSRMTGGIELKTSYAGQYSAIEFSKLIMLMYDRELANWLTDLRNIDNISGYDSFILKGKSEVWEKIKPRQYIIKKFAYRFNDEKFVDNSKRYPFQQLIYGHERTAQFDKEDMANNGRLFLANQDDSYHKVNVLRRPELWTIPDPRKEWIEQDIKEFYRKRGVLYAVERERNKNKKEFSIITTLRDRHRGSWLEEFEKKIQEETKETFNFALSEDRFNWIRRIQNQRLEPVNKISRIATRNYEAISDDLNEAFSDLFTFRRDIVLSNDNDIKAYETSKLIFELGSNFPKALLKALEIDFKRRNIIIGKYLPLLEAALRIANNNQLDFQRFSEEITQIKSVVEAFHKVLKELQVNFGFEGKIGNPPLLKTLKGIKLLEPGNPFFFKEQVFELVEVMTDFKYHPPFGYHWRDPFSDSIPNTYLPIIMIGGVDHGESENPIELFKLLIDGKEEIISYDKKNGDTIKFLNNMTLKLDFLAAGNYMKWLSKNIVSVVEKMQYIPGIGLVVDATILADGITEALKGADDLVHVLLDYPREYFFKLKTEIQELAKPEEMILFLFLGGKGIKQDINKQETPKEKRKSQSRKTGPFGRIVDLAGSIFGAGKRLFDSLSNMRERVSTRFSIIRNWILGHPTLIHWVQKIINKIQGFGEPRSSQDDLNLLDSEKREFANSLSETLNEFSPVSLPKEIIDMSQVVQLTLNIVLNMAMRSKKLQVAHEAIKLLDADDYLASLIWSWMSSKGIDPNILWKSEVVEKLQEALNDVQGEIWDQLKSKIKEYAGEDILEEIGFSGVEIESDEGDEVQPYLTRIPLETAILKGFDQVHSGEPLNKKTRIDAEERFGQDFGHVRFHKDQKANQITESLGAAALTSGSHIYFASNHDPNSNGSKNILFHELTHVIQQTGNRPIRQAHPQQPVPGKPHTGLNLDPSLEQEAGQGEKLANKLSPNEFSELEQTHSDGLQPAGLSSNTFARLLEELTSFESLSDEKERTEKEAILQAKNPKFLTPPYKSAAAIWGNLAIWLTDNYDYSNPKFPGYMAGLKVPVKNSIKGINLNEILVLAGRSLKKKPKSKTYQLDVKTFVRLLEGFLLAKTGIGIKIDWRGKWDPKNARRPPPRFSITYYRLLLPLVTSDSIWNEILNLLKNHSIFRRIRNRPRDNELKNRIKGYLFTLKWGEEPFKSNKFELKEKIVKGILAYKLPELHTGLQDDPIPILWYKERKDYRDPIVYKGKNWPMALSRLPNSDDSFHPGVDMNKYWNKNFVRKEPLKYTGEPKTASRRNSDKFREEFAKAGNRLSDLDLEVDHVMDLQYGGEDVFTNLWPLNKKINALGRKWSSKIDGEFVLPFALDKQDTEVKYASMKHLARFGRNFYKVVGFSKEGPNPDYKT